MAVDGEDLLSASRADSARRMSRAQVTGWILALLPVTWGAFDMLAVEVFGASDSLQGALLFAALTNWAVVLADSAALRAVGVRVSAWWGLLLLPVYVVLRTKRARSSPLVPVVFFALAVAYLVFGDLILKGAG